jgi:hypothetical protein
MRPIRTIWQSRPLHRVLLALICSLVALTLHSAERERERGYLQYFQDSQQLFAWRETEVGSELKITLDYPENRQMDRTEAFDFKRRLTLQHQKAALSLLQFTEEQISFASASRAPLFENAPPVLTQSRSGDCKLANYTLNRISFKRDPPTPEFVARLKPGVCRTDSALAKGGSASMISPEFAFTAAHILIQKGKLQDCDYRLIPGADRFDGARPQPLGSSHATVLALAKPDLDILDRIDEVSEAQFNSRSNADWALLKIGPSSVASKSLAKLWPIYEFADGIDADQHVIKSGFPRGNKTRALRAAGASLSSQGLRVCQSERGSELFALTADFGDSGAPIWVSPQFQAQQRLRVVSLVSSTEVFGSVPRVHGPKFSIDMYWRTLSLLRQSQL